MYKAVLELQKVLRNHFFREGGKKMLRSSLVKQTEAAHIAPKLAEELSKVATQNPAFYFHFYCEALCWSQMILQMISKATHPKARVSKAHRLKAASLQL